MTINSATVQDHTHAAYYDDKWTTAVNENDVPVDDERYEELVGLLRKHNNRPRPRILDVGCGVGWLTARLTEFGDVTGIDTSDGAIAEAKRCYPGPAYHTANIITGDNASLHGVFDVVVSSEVLEHIPDQIKPKFSSALINLLVPGGLLILTTPNKAVWNRYWRLPSTERWRQPIEDWVTRQELHRHFGALARLESYTYGFWFDKSLYYRLWNSSKVARLASSIGLESAFQRARADKGLYIAGAFRKQR